MIREVVNLVQPEVQKHAVVVEEALAEGLLPVLETGSGCSSSS